MNKKQYMTPEITVVGIETMRMIAFSGGGQDVDVSGNEDLNDIINRSRDGFGFDNDDDIIMPYGGNTYMPF